MIALRKRRDLDLAAPITPGRPSYLSAASGLVRLDDLLYVIADDEHHLGAFRHDDASPGTLLELIEGELPHEPKARKKAKPDFEALTRLPPFNAHPHGALLASGSGSKPNRCKGALVRLAADGLSKDPVRIVDLRGLMEPLTTEFKKVNIEGMAVTGDEVCVFQRGNKGHKRNAVVRFSLAEVLSALMVDSAAPLTPLVHKDYALGEIDGVPLTFTDAAALADGALIFSAVAEDTDNSFTDGLCHGTAIGLINPDGVLAWIQRAGKACKIEGIDVREDGETLHLLLVTDADNIDIPASLFSAQVNRRNGQSP